MQAMSGLHPASASGERDIQNWILFLLRCRNGILTFDSNLLKDHQVRQKLAEAVYVPYWHATPPLLVCLAAKLGASAGQNASEII